MKPRTSLGRKHPSLSPLCPFCLNVRQHAAPVLWVATLQPCGGAARNEIYTASRRQSKEAVGILGTPLSRISFTEKPALDSRPLGILPFFWTVSIIWKKKEDFTDIGCCFRFYAPSFSKHWLLCFREHFSFFPDRPLSVLEECQGLHPPHPSLLL